MTNNMIEINVIEYLSKKILGVFSRQTIPRIDEVVGLLNVNYTVKGVYHNLEGTQGVVLTVRKRSLDDK